MRRSAVLLTASAVLVAGLAVPSAALAADPPHVVIDEFSASTVGTDVEYVELLAPAGIDLSEYRVLALEGDTGSAIGSVDRIVTFPAPDASGRSLASLPANALENGTLSLLLVTGFTGAAGDDLDANDDGALDTQPWTSLVDAVAVNDGGAGDVTYGGVTLGVAYDGLSFAPGGASRIPDGTDTDSAADWMRNDFDLAGIDGYAGTPVDGEALNTPGAVNKAYEEPTSGGADCTATYTRISEVQGSGDASPLAGQTVHVEGVVTGDFQPGLTGYFIQSADGDADADPATSEGLFVYAPGSGALDVAPGDLVHVVGEVSEFGGLTELTVDSAAVCATGVALPAATDVTLPIAAYEPLEGMRVRMPQTLTILEYFEFDRYGTIEAGLGRQFQPTAVYTPGSAEASALAAKNAAERITIDDGRSVQNPDPAIHPDGATFTLDHRFRGGDELTNVTGILDHHFDGWRIQPTQGSDYTAADPRPGVPAVGGDVKVASFNVLNYFTTLGARGATTAEEFTREQAKIVSAISQIDADVVGLLEIENNGGDADGGAVANLVAALNAKVGAGTYAYIPTGVVGTDEITTAMIYQPARVTPQGDHAILTSAVDPRFVDTKNRPALAQTFAADGGLVTVVVNHLKSKGSDCNDLGDPDLGDGAGNCNVTRTQAAAALVDWIATDPTHQGAADRALIIGDLNSYDHETPITTLTAGGYTDLEKKFHGEYAYSYDFDGQFGYLDYALAGTGLGGHVTEAEAWHINADEPDILDYTMQFKQPAQDALYAPDPFRASDHDPVVIGLDLTPPDTTAPTLAVSAQPQRILLPTGTPRTVRITVRAADDSGDVQVKLVGATASGRFAKVTRRDDTTFTVLAVYGAKYTFTYTATDAAGNSTTASTVVTVGLPLPWLPF